MADGERCPGDSYGSRTAWVVSFRNGQVTWIRIDFRNYVRPVRTMKWYGFVILSSHLTHPKPYLTRLLYPNIFFVILEQ